MAPFPSVDELIVAFDKGLRTVFAPAQTLRPVPGEELSNPPLSDSQRALSAALMRVNHTGEICAQALYQGQALTARNLQAKAALEQAAQEETEHLAWTERRIAELGGRKSLLNPAWYAGSFAIGALAGLSGDRTSLGFVDETEKQVCAHLDSHLDSLPPEDERSRRIVAQMKADEDRHAAEARAHGAVLLPKPIRELMRRTARVMTRTAYRL
jgi:ubiquinone biosynthesis monooxygenase Coq7